MPNWIKIAKWYFPEIESMTNKETHEFVIEFIKKFKIDKDASLYNKPGFSFVEFRDGVSGLNPIWSDRWKEFVSDLEIRGYFLVDKEGESELTPKGGGGMHISPNYIQTQDGETISSMPFDDIVNLFVQIEKETGTAHYQVKKFPEKFQDVFDKQDIVYEPDFHIYTSLNHLGKSIVKSDSAWFKESGMELYEQTVEAHIFKTPYFEIKFNFRFFGSDDIRPYTTDLSRIS